MIGIVENGKINLKVVICDFILRIVSYLEYQVKK